MSGIGHVFRVWLMFLYINFRSPITEKKNQAIMSGIGHIFHEFLILLGEDQASKYLKIGTRPA